MSERAGEKECVDFVSNWEKGEGRRPMRDKEALRARVGGSDRCGSEKKRTQRAVRGGWREGLTITNCWR